MVVFNVSTVIYIDAFGDTLAVVTGNNFRGQPDGSFDFQGEARIPGANNSWKRTEAGGHIFLDNQGNYVVDGHFFQESDSSGIHKSIPGQMCARIAKADFSITAVGAKGDMKGWIAQDKSGSGFVANPINTQPCDPAKGPCTTQPCDPSKGPCVTDPNQCPPGAVCGPVTNPGPTSFGRPFMGGAPNYRAFVANKLSVKEGEYFYISMGGRVYRVKNDSTGVSNTLFPMCGQVALKLELLPMKDETDMSKQARNADSMSSQIGQSVLIAMEDQFMAGMPAMLDKARDSYGDVHNNVLIVEMRPIGPDYGKTSTQCPTVVQNPGCDPTKQVCGPVPGDTSKCDPAKQTCTQPCDPSKQVCQQPGNQGQAPLYLGTLDAVKAALVTSNNLMGVVKDSTGAYDRIEVDLASLVKDPMSQMVMVGDKNHTGKFAFLSDFSDKMKLLIKDGYPMAGKMPNDPNQQPPQDTTKPVVTNPQPDTTKPPLYKGTVENLKNVLASKSNKVVVATPQGPVPAQVDPNSVQSDGTIATAVDANNSAMIYVFMGDKADATKPAIGPDGNILVTVKPTTAGP
jgi:hypothetical protein